MESNFKAVSIERCNINFVSKDVRHPQMIDDKGQALGHRSSSVLSICGSFNYEPGVFRVALRIMVQERGEVGNITIDIYPNHKSEPFLMADHSDSQSSHHRSRSSADDESVLGTALTVITAYPIQLYHH